MSLKDLRSLDVLVVILSLFFAQTLDVISARDSANIEAVVGDFVVNVNGQQNVPKYTIYNNQDSQQKYTLQLSQTYECVGGFNLSTCQKVSGSNVALSSLIWVFTNPEDQEDGSMTFQISSVGEADRFTSLVLDNQVFSSFDTVQNVTVSEVKFNLTINDYSWASSDEGAMLVVKFNFQNNGNQNVYFTTVKEAIDSSGHLVVVDMETTGDAGTALVFQHFNGSVYLDPTFGMKNFEGSSAYFITPSLFITTLFLLVLM